uniref:Uncharacterized protein n=1 Tax=Timema genevievae TaxID=629358 RepID=A0A7R9K029_TIMGE|nr:unnamed protein product [Timema genevievae]
MATLSKKDIEDIKPYVDKAVQKFLGFSEQSLVTVAMSCLASGYDKKKTATLRNPMVQSLPRVNVKLEMASLKSETVTPEKWCAYIEHIIKEEDRMWTLDGLADNVDHTAINTGDEEDRLCLLAGKLSSLLDEKKAARLTEKIFELAEEGKVPHRPAPSKKRQHETMMLDDNEAEAKKARLRFEAEQMVFFPSGSPSPGQLTAIQIKEMMANAQKMIEERKRALNALRADEAPPVRAVTFRNNDAVVIRPSLFGPPPPPTIPMLIQRGDSDKARKIAALQAQIQSKLTTGVLNNIPQIRPFVQDKPAPLILNKEGRTVDVSGKEVQLSHPTPTLKANIRAKKREEFRQQLQEQVVDNLAETKFFDPRLGAKSAVRVKRALRFHEPGKFQQLANSMRMKAQLDKLQNEISQIAKKTGISSATKLALIAPKTQSAEEQVPDVEWWDSVVLRSESYFGPSGDSNLKPGAVSNLVEHPTQLRPPTEPLKPVYMPVFLTQKERKKLRRQNRREAWKEEQEKIRLGLEPPPEPKLRISNLMRVLGTEAIQDPTKIEAHVREQMAKRQKAHEEANAARRLTAEQKRDKKVRKLTEDTTLGVQVSVYRIKELSNAAKKYKVETNARQLFMTGCVVLFKDCNVVVVEGGIKQHKKYRKLMLSRIKWEEDAVRSVDGREVPNKCVLVWEGSIKQRTFGEMKFKVCPTEKLAREHFKKHSVEHYWDLAYSGAVFEVTDDV